MFTKFLKTLFLSFVLAIFCCAPVFAASELPFEVEFDLDPVERICYAGHGSGAIRYRDGYAVLPDTYFSIYENKDQDQSSEYDISDVSVEVALIYENETNDGSYKEVLRSYEPGSLSTENIFPILSENTIANLEDRDKLYSDTLSGLVLTLKCKGVQGKKETMYLYVCDDDEYYEYLDNQISEE